MTGFIPVPPDPWVPTATDSETKLFPAATMDALDEHNDGRYATTEQGEKADSAYQLPEDGVPATDLAEAVRASLENADSALQPGVAESGFDDAATALFNDDSSAFRAAHNAAIAAPIRVNVPIPEALGWYEDYDMVDPHITIYPDGSVKGDIGIAVGSAPSEAAALFDLFSTARAAPTSTYAVAAGQNIGGGITANRALSSGQSNKVVVAGGTYPSGIGICGTSQGATSQSPSRDIALIASGGPVFTGPYFDSTKMAAFAVDGTHTATYSVNSGTWAAHRVVDLWTQKDLRLVASAAICNVTPDSWYEGGGKVYVNRADGAAPTSRNTRIVMDQNNLLLLNQINIFMGSEDGSPWILDGGRRAASSTSDGAPLRVQIASPTSARKVFVVDQVAANYAGGFGALANAVTLQCWSGLAALFGVSGIRPAKDGINSHNNNSGEAAVNCVLTVNCHFDELGFGDNVSMNAITPHDNNNVWIDIAGRYSGGQGGTIRPDVVSGAAAPRSLLVGTYIAFDKGDLFTASGSTPPTAFLAAADSWWELHYVTIRQPGGIAIKVEDGATVRLSRTCRIEGAIIGDVEWID